MPDEDYIDDIQLAQKDQRQPRSIEIMLAPTDEESDYIEMAQMESEYGSRWDTNSAFAQTQFGSRSQMDAELDYIELAQHTWEP